MDFGPYRLVILTVASLVRGVGRVLKQKTVLIGLLLLVEMSGLWSLSTPTLSEKCMFFRGFIRTALNVPKIKAFGHIKKSFDVKQKCTLDIS